MGEDLSPVTPLVTTTSTTSNKQLLDLRGQPSTASNTPLHRHLCHFKYPLH